MRIYISIKINNLIVSDCESSDYHLLPKLRACHEGKNLNERHSIF